MPELHVLPAGKVGHQSRDDFVVAVRLGFSLNVFLKSNSLFVLVLS